jgi:hypothetical protein
MLEKLRSDLGARAFWSWFSREAGGYRNAVEALVRGEDDASEAFARLNRRLRRFSPGLAAHLSRSPDGRCMIRLSGGAGPVQALLRTAREVPGWGVAPGDVRLPVSGGAAASPARRTVRRARA